MSPRVAVIDVGSNSIKALVAESRDGLFLLNPLFEESLEVRISQGIGGEPPMLHPERIEAGVEAVKTLWSDCQKAGPIQELKIVATSAVRTAANGHIFMEAVEQSTGIHPIILTGSEEAQGIANGVRTDPAIEENLDDFTVFDLGGGSLELIRFEHHGITDRTSLPLGSVRLTEQFISDPAMPVPEAELSALREHIHSHVVATGIPVKDPLVGCSGGLAAMRHVIAKRAGTTFEDVFPVFRKDFVDELARAVFSQDLHQRIKKSGLPPWRADIFPTALVTFQVLMDLAEARQILHSLHNLRYGIAWQMLQD